MGISVVSPFLFGFIFVWLIGQNVLIEIPVTPCKSFCVFSILVHLWLVILK